MSDWPAENARAKAKVFRRPKRTPKQDMWHTLAVGLPIGAAMLVVLPLIFDALF